MEEAVFILFILYLRYLQGRHRQAAERERRLLMLNIKLCAIRKESRQRRLRRTIKLILLMRGVRPVVWCKPKSKEWWEQAISGAHGGKWWNDNLRMSCETFECLCSELRPYVQRYDTNFRLAVSVEARIAVTLWRLSTNAEYRTIAELFGLGRSTVGEIVIDTCEVIAKHIFNRYVYMPHGDELRQVINNFESRTGFPQVAGAIDGTHIPILKLDHSPSDYYNRKGFYSIIMQAVVDSNGLFLDAYIGWPGKVHDTRVLINSTLYKKAMANRLLPNWTRQLCGVDIPLLILGDPAYPLLPWLMKPYVENQHSTPEERNFNYRQNRARMTVENAFGRLKGRWRCLLKRMDTAMRNVPNVVAACVVLHNYCERHGDQCQPEWIYRENEVTTSQQQNTRRSTSRETAHNVRNALKLYLNN